VAGSLRMLVPVSLREAARCTVQGQKQQPARPFRACRYRGLRGPISRPETIVSRHWWTATRPPTPVTTVARRSHPRRNAAPTTHRPLRTLDDRVTPRPPTRQQEPLRAIAAPPPSGRATAPAAIAAAAIAARTAAPGAPAASAAQVKADSGAAVATAATAPATAAAAVAGTKIEVQTAPSATAAASVNRPATQSDAT